MSHQATAWALDARRTGPLHPAQRLVLVALADYADPEGHGAYPSKQTLALRLGITSRNVQKHLKALRDAGLIYAGDDLLVSHYPADRRPTVYNLWINRESESTPRPNGESFHDTTGSRTGSERGVGNDSQTKNLNHQENPTPQTPHVAHKGTCAECGAREVTIVTADGLCRPCLFLRESA